MAATDPLQPVEKSHDFVPITLSLEAGLTKITTKLSKDSALVALRELVPASYNFVLLKSGFEGDVDPRRLRISYRFGWFVPPLKVATFSGRVVDTADGAMIEGDVKSNWIVYFFAAWFLVVVPYGAFHLAYVEPLSTIFWNLALAVVLLFLGIKYVDVTHQHIVDEICRATRGTLAED